ncbi:MAG: four helix bundle protein [Nanoarchaeota archaeon]
MTSDFKNLKVWQKAMDFAEWIYQHSNRFPSHEKMGLTSQLQRAVVSVTANIAEGCGKSTKTDFIRFLHISYGSVKEVENYIILASRLKYLSTADIEEATARCQEISKMLFSLIQRLKSGQ